MNNNNNLLISDCLGNVLRLLKNIIESLVYSIASSCADKTSATSVLERCLTYSESTYEGERKVGPNSGYPFLRGVRLKVIVAYSRYWIQDSLSV